MSQANPRANMAPNLDSGTRYQVLGMKRARKSPKAIANTMNIHLSSVYSILKRANDRDGNLEDLGRAGRPPSKVTKRNIDIIRKRVQRAPTRSIRALSRSMDMDKRTMGRLVAAAGFRSVSKLVVHELMPGQEERRFERAVELLQWRQEDINADRDIIWTDEKNFVLEQHFNKRNDRVLIPADKAVAYDPSIRIVKRRKKPCSVMVFGAMGSDGSVMDPIIIPPSTTVTSVSYQELVLPKLLAWMKETYGPKTGYRGKEGVGRCILMQDGAPAHTSRSTQAYLEQNLGKDNFWGKQQWPPSSPDCNPLDFSFWNELATAVTAVSVPPNRTELVRRLEQVWHQVLTVDYVARTCKSAWDRLRRVRAARGGYIERFRSVRDAKEDVVDENNNVME